METRCVTWCGGIPWRFTWGYSPAEIIIHLLNARGLLQQSSQSGSLFTFLAEAADLWIFQRFEGAGSWLDNLGQSGNHMKLYDPI